MKEAKGIASKNKQLVLPSAAHTLKTSRYEILRLNGSNIRKKA